MQIISFRASENNVYYLDVTNMSYCDLVELKKTVNDEDMLLKVNDAIKNKSYFMSQPFFVKENTKKIKKQMNKRKIKERMRSND